MSIEDTLGRLADNVVLLTGAVATLAEAINGGYKGEPVYQGDAPQATPAVESLVGAATGTATPRGRGRPRKVDAAASQAPAPSPEAADPFAATTPAAPVASLEDVRKALTELKAATTQDIALSVLKAAGGVDNLSALPTDRYGVVAQAAARKQAEYAKSPTPEADPFEATSTPAAKPVTLEEVKAAVVAAQKRTGTDTVQKVVMDHGGRAKTDTGYAPSLKALPADKFATVIAAIAALPTTK